MNGSGVPTSHLAASRVWGVGILGAGDIAPRYIESLRYARNLRLILIASRTREKMETMATRFGLAPVSPEQLFADSRIDLILILTPPQHHAQAIRAALCAGKHVFCEKPFASSRNECDELIAMARDRSLMLATAPATHLGPSVRALRELIRNETLGDVVGAAGTMIYPGPDLWHHDPDHLFAQGGGPLFDMGVYHLTVLVHLLGPIEAVHAFSGRYRSERTIVKGPSAGTSVPVEVDTHVSINLRFASGAIGHLTCSFDGFGSRAPGLEIYGSKGSVAMGQPNDFTAPLAVSTAIGSWQEQPTDPVWNDRMWAIGVVEAVAAWQRNAPPAADPAAAAHVIDVMHSVDQSVSNRCQVPVQSSCDRVYSLQPLDTDLWEPETSGHYATQE